MSAGFQGFSDSVSTNLSRDMDFNTLVQIMHDQETFRRERGLEESLDYQHMMKVRAGIIK
jgi:hypothetical protein